MEKTEETRITSLEASESPSPDPSTTGSADKPAVSGHWARYTKVFTFFGFQKAYNFPLWVIFAGAMLGFSLRSLQDYDETLFSENIGPGLMYYFHSGSYRIGMLVHLIGCLPAGILMVLQFTPVIRRKWITFHRLNGYLVLLLLLMSNGAVSVVLHHNQGGNRIAAQTAEAFLVLITTVGIVLAWWNVKRLQIDQHRAWMLRTMFYYGTIITSRFLTDLASTVVTRLGGYYMVWSCDELTYSYNEYGLGALPADKYPQCFAPNATGSTIVPVEGWRNDDLVDPPAFGSAYNAPFGSMLWIAIAAHIIGVEIYLNLTPAESHRLRRISYEKQLEAGFANPGSAGITAERWGDAERYVP